MVEIDVFYVDVLVLEEAVLVLVVEVLVDVLVTAFTAVLVLLQKSSLYVITLKASAYKSSQPQMPTSGLLAENLNKIKKFTAMPRQIYVI
jgi:hypothetical protein